MKKILIVLCLFCCFKFIHAQLPPACPSSPLAPSEVCDSACVHCIFSGTQFTTGESNFQSPLGLCGFSSSYQWLAFVAGTQSGIFTVIPSNCSSLGWFQVAIFGCCGGLPLGCADGISSGGNAPISVSVDNLELGKIYYLMIGSSWIGQCDYNIVTSPQSVIAPSIPDIPDSLFGPTEICSYATVEYCVPPISGAWAYTWDAPTDALINGMSPPVTILASEGGSCVSVKYGNKPGVICVNGASYCLPGLSFCQPVTVLPPGPLGGQVLLQYPDVVVCPSDLPYVTPWGETVNGTGVYSTSHPLVGKCDSVERQSVLVKSSHTTVCPPLVFCDDGFEVVCGDTIFAGTTATVTCKDVYGCDSLVTFSTVLDTLSVAQINNGDDTIFVSSWPVHLSFPNSHGIPIWYYNGTAIGSSFELIVNNPGEYVLRLQSFFYGNICFAYDTVQLVNLVQGSEPLSQAHFSVQPTIGQGQYFLKTESGTMQQLRLFDLHGRLVFEEKIQNAKAFTLDVPEIPAGSYLLTVLVNGVWEKVRLVKQ